MLAEAEETAQAHLGKQEARSFTRSFSLLELVAWSELARGAPFGRGGDFPEDELILAAGGIGKKMVTQRDFIEKG